MKYTICLMLIPVSFLWADFGVKDQWEFHSKYQNFKCGLQDVIIYHRMDYAIHLPETWQLYIRLDIPYMWLWGDQKEVISIGDDGLIVAPDSCGCHTIVKKTAFQEHGLSDIATRAFFVTPPLNQPGTITLGFGSEFTFPTAQDVDIGSGKYAARSMIGFKWDLPTVGMGGSSFAFLAKYLFSYAGHKNRTSYQILFFQPVFVYNFATHWALVFSPEIQYNVRKPGWFIPFSVNIGRTIGSHFAGSVSYQKGIITQFPVFENEVELTLRYVF